jgi:hypothetical protein
MAGADQHLHSFLGGKGLGIQQGTSVGVGLPKPVLMHVIKKTVTKGRLEGVSIPRG